MPDLRPARLALAAAAILLPATFARAQAPVDNQVGRVDNRVGGELYGGMNNSTSRYPVGQYRLLPSEERFAIQRSGMLPSEYQLNRSAYGPLPPEGRLNYVTPQSPLQRAMGLPQPQLANPQYDPTAAQPGQRLGAFAEPTPGGYPQTVQAGAAASGRITGKILPNRPLVPRFDASIQQQQPQPNGSPLPPMQLGPVEVEPPTPATNLPRPLQPGPTTSPSAPVESDRNPPPQPVVPSLTGAPDRPLPTGEPPPATPAGLLLPR
jgi:hypothetical protein